MEQKELATPVPRPREGVSDYPDTAKPWKLLSPGIWELVLNESISWERSVCNGMNQERNHQQTKSSYTHTLRKCVSWTAP